MSALNLVNLGVLSVNCYRYILLKLNCSDRRLIMILFVFLYLLSSATKSCFSSESLRFKLLLFLHHRLTLSVTTLLCSSLSQSLRLKSSNCCQPFKDVLPWLCSYLCTQIMPTSFLRTNCPPCESVVFQGDLSIQIQACIQSFPFSRNQILNHLNLLTIVQVQTVTIFQRSLNTYSWLVFNPTINQSINHWIFYGVINSWPVTATNRIEAWRWSGFTRTWPIARRRSLLATASRIVIEWAAVFHKDQCSGLWNSWPTLRTFSDLFDRNTFNHHLFADDQQI